MATTLNNLQPGTGPGWTTYAPPEHELLTHKLLYEIGQAAEDCRGFAQAARLAQLNNLPEKFGLSWDDFCVQQLQHASEFVEAIILGIEELGEEMPVPLEVARRVGREKKAARAQKNQTANDVKVRRKGRPENSNTKNKDVTIFSESIRGNSPSYAMRRLAKHRPDLHVQCLAGDLTAHAAMVQAGFLTRPQSRKRTPFDALLQHWRKFTLEEQVRFIREMLSQEERDALTRELVEMETRTT